MLLTLFFLVKNTAKSQNMNVVNALKSLPTLRQNNSLKNIKFHANKSLNQGSLNMFSHS